MALSGSNDTTIDVLSSLCRRELAFVESYRRALAAGNLREHGSRLATCLRSHEQRAELLKSRIRALKAEPPSTGGVLGTVAKLVEGAAAALGEKAGISALEEEEDLGMRSYRSQLAKLDSETQALIKHQVLPAQVETHRLMSELKQSLATGRTATQH